MDVVIVKSPHIVSFSGNPMPFVFALTPYADLQRNQDYKLQVNVLLEDVVGSNSYNLVFSQVFYPDDTGKINMDVSSIVDAYLYNFTPKLSLERPRACRNQRKQFKVSYQVQLADAFINTLTTTSVYYAIKGGLGYEEWNPDLFFDNNIAVQKQPLHFAPAGEKVSLTQPLFLSWIYPSDDQTNQRTVHTFYFDDGTSATYTNTALVKNNYKWGVQVAPAGIEQIGYTPPDGKTIVYFTVHIKNTGGDVIASPFTYYVDYRTFYEEYVLVYRNSLGGLDTIRLRGEVDAEADYTYQRATRITGHSYYTNNILLPQILQENNSEALKFTGDTGFISKAALNNLRDLYLSKEIYQVSGNKMIPIVLNGKNAKLYKNNDNLFSLQFQWQYAFDNEFYTAQNTVAPYASCPAVENLQVIQINKDTLQIIWSLPTPYDRVKVQVDNGTTVKTYYYTGNSGIKLQAFTNPAGDDPADVTVTAQTLCDEDSVPNDLGPTTTKTISVTAENNPVANDDNFTLASGFNSPVELDGNVLDNDYDPDGDAIEAVPDSGATTEGGSFSLDADGTVTYQPPSSTFTGNDTFDYQCREVATPANVSNTATVNIAVGGAGSTFVYVRMALVIDVWNEDQDTGDVYGAGRYILYFYSDSAGTIPIDVSTIGLSCNYHTHETFWGGVLDGDHAAACSGISTTIYNGTLENNDTTDPTANYKMEITMLAGTGYSVIP